MKLVLIGHDYKYAVEQIMLAVFPDERPDYTDGPGLSAESRLTLGGVYAQAVTVIRNDRNVYFGISKVNRKRLTDKLTTDRLLQRIIKQSFYRAAIRMTEDPPPWGSLTGIRPAKLATAVLESGGSEKSAAEMLMRDYYVSAERAELCARAARTAYNVKRTLKPADIALYIGIPFCPTRCAYCSFVSNSVEKSFGLIDPFVDILLREVDAAARLIDRLDLRVTSVYIGGGTPTALSPQQLDSIMCRLGSALDLSYLLEYTVEAGRPDTITAEKLETILKHGASRISVNPQTSSDSVLSAIGRKHTHADTLRAAELVRAGGVPAVNMDIIAGLPSDTVQGFCDTVETVLALMPENITVHTLSLKKGSRIMLEGTEIPDGASVAAMLNYAARRLRACGYEPYYLYRQKFTSGGFENVGWSLPGFEGIYNVCMMEELSTVLALGGGGVTKLVSQDGRIERIFNAKYPREYILSADNTEEKMRRIAEFYTNPQ